MIPFIIISLIAIIYAIIRAKHDSYISHSKWKTWAFIEAVFIDLVVISLIIYAFDLRWWIYPFLYLSFAFIFWIFFDCITGWIRCRNILHIGTVGFDALMRKTFKYKKGYLYLAVKLWFAAIIIGGTINILNNV